MVEYSTRNGLVESDDSRLGPVSGVELTPVRITLIYLGFGLVALFVSDVVLVAVLEQPLLRTVQAAKGLGEVVLTAGLIFVLTRRRQVQLRRARDELTAQRDELHLLHRVVRHNLSNDLNIIEGFLDLLESEIDSEEGTRYYGKLTSTVARMEDYIDHLHRIKETTETGADVVTVNLAEVVPDLLASHSAITEEVTVKTDLPDSVTVRCNHMLEEAFDEVIRNAVEHNPTPDTVISVTVEEATAPAGMVAVDVVDDGPGVPAAERAALDAEGQPPLLHSTGLGLWFVDWMVRHSGGDLHVEDAEPGTRVRMVLPEA